VKDAAFYCYAAPEPQGFSTSRVRPEPARYEAKVGEFLLPYEDVRRSSSPTSTVLEFMQSTYEAGADAGKWDRNALEKPPSVSAGAA
jgi:hypothetical protein